MTWLAVGIFYGTTVPNMELAANVADDDDAMVYLMIGRLFMVLFFSASAVGGFVVVGQMLISHGHCIQIGEASF